MRAEELGRLLDTDVLWNRSHGRAEAGRCVFGLEYVEDVEAVRAFPSRMNEEASKGRSVATRCATSRS